MCWHLELFTLVWKLGKMLENQLICLCFNVFFSMSMSITVSNAYLNNIETTKLFSVSFHHFLYLKVRRDEGKQIWKFKIKIIKTLSLCFFFHFYLLPLPLPPIFRLCKAFSFDFAKFHFQYRQLGRDYCRFFFFHQNICIFNNLFRFKLQHSFVICYF